MSLKQTLLAAAVGFVVGMVVGMIRPSCYAGDVLAGRVQDYFRCVMESR